MSRWRETLCGSVVLSRAPETAEAASLKAQSDILSCGGIYLPYQRTPISKKDESFVFHLAKEQYEVLVLQNSQNLQETQRYGELVPDNTGDVPLFGEVRYLDLKLGK